VLAPLRRLMAGRTSLIISHNLLTVTDADHILYLDKGRVTAAGTHVQLLSTSPGYAQLYRMHQGPLAPRPASRPGPHVQPHPLPARPLPRPTPSAPPEVDTVKTRPAEGDTVRTRQHERGPA